jgi:hypothetical protein
MEGHKIPNSVHKRINCVTYLRHGTVDICRRCCTGTSARQAFETFQS